MMTTATHNAHDTTPEAVLFMAFELSENTWKLGFSLGHGHKPRERTMAAHDLNRSIGKSNGLFHRLPRYPVRGPARPPRAAHPGAHLARGGPEAPRASGGPALDAG